MVGILAAVVAVVGVVATADLLLSFAVVRRLAALEAPGGRPGAAALDSPAAGDRVGEFRARLLDGGEFTRADLAGASVLVVFVMPGCEPCQTVLADLRALPEPLPAPLYVLATGTEQDNEIVALAGGLPAGHADRRGPARGRDGQGLRRQRFPDRADRRGRHCRVGRTAGDARPDLVSR